MGLDITLIRIVNYSTDDLNFLRADENPELESKFGQFKMQRKVDHEVTHGYYYEDLGHQRKGVTPEFYNHYQPDEFIFTKEELTALTAYIRKEYHASFTADIVDKFEEGITIVWIGY